MDIAEILAMDDSHREVVTVPEWNNSHISVFSMTATERAEIEKKWSSKNAESDPALFRADVLERCLKKEGEYEWGCPLHLEVTAIDENATCHKCKSDMIRRLKPLATRTEILQLLSKNANAIERLFEVACKVSGFSRRDVEDLEKN